VCEQGQHTRRRIVEAAADLIFHHGVAGTSIPSVQQAANVSASQIYHYFGDKTGLIRAVIAYRLSGAEESGAFRADRFESIAAIEEWRDIVLALQIERDCFGGCEFGSLASELDDSEPVYRSDAIAGFARLGAPMRDGLRTVQARGELTADADPDTLALALLSALQGGLLINKARRDVTALRAVLDTVIDRIRELSTDRAAEGAHR
jgi:AcrR family transcriptional regulator